MKLSRILTTSLFLVFLTNFALAQNIQYCSSKNFESFNSQADSIKLFMEKAISSNSEEKDKWERAFFCAFPNSFSTMDSIFGYHGKPAPLYYSDIPKDESIFGSMNSYISYFSKLSSIPSIEYYNKYINLCVNGYWQADNIRVAFGIGTRLLKDTKPLCEILSKRSDVEVKSIFRFIFDGPHPKNNTNKVFYEQLYNAINQENKKLSKLLMEAYTKLINEKHNH